MATAQLFPRACRTVRVDLPIRRLANFCVVLTGLVLLFSSSVLAQGSVPLVTVATDQSSLNLSNQFGVPAGTAINQAGDFAFVGNGDTALFLRTAGASAATRLLQIDDEAPGFPGSQILSFLPELGINSSRWLLFGVRFDGGDNLPRSALLIYDGTSYHTVVSSDEIAPGSGGGTYGLDLVPGSIDDIGDINFAAVPDAFNSTTFYIVPFGGMPVRIVGLNDNPPPPPPPCTNCFFFGVPVGGTIITGSPLSILVPRLNAKGQMLLSLWNGLFIGSKDGTLSSVSLATSGACSIQPVTTGNPFNPFLETSAFLNNSGAVAFTNPSNSTSTTICVATPGGGIPTAVIASGDSAPPGVGNGTTILSPFALGFDDSGDIVYQAAISGSNLTTIALLRYHPSNVPADVVAYDCEPAPGTSGSVFSLVPLPTSVSCGPSGVISLLSLSSPFQGISIANDGSVGFNASLSSGESAIYRQKTGAAAPEFISLDNDGIFPVPGTSGAVILSPFNSTGAQTEVLNNGSVFFSSYLTSGAADFAVYLGTPGNVQTLMSTADTLPSGARTILGGAPPRAAGHFVAFTAQPAAGRINLLEADLTKPGTITRVASDNDPAFITAGGPSGSSLVAPNFFLNENGQVAFETVGALSGLSGFSFVSFGSSPVNNAWVDSAPRCGTIYLWSPSGGLAKVASAGDTAPNSSAKFSCVALNSGPPSPLNRSGQLAFSSFSSLLSLLPCTLCDPFSGNSAAGVDGVYLYSPGGAISEIAAANDTLPGQTQPTTFVPYLQVPLDSAGQVAFGAQVGATSQGFFLENGTSVQKVVVIGDPVPRTGSDTFGFPHFMSALTDNGNLAFTAATGAATDGLFLAPAGSAIQTIALDGSAAPGLSGGTFSLTSGGPTIVSPTGTSSVIPILRNFAAINGESDVAFGASITGGSADSGYFRMLQSGAAAGTLQPVVLQGQAAPGGGTFNTINLLSSQGGNFALGPDGTLAFANTFATSSGTSFGLFVARPDGTLLKVAAAGDPLPLPGGGVLSGLALSSKLAAGDTGKFAFLAGILGGSARRAIFVTALPPGTASTTTTLNQLQSPPVAQQAATLTAAVTSATAGTPTGTVTFFANGVSLGTGTLNSTGQATLTTSSLAAGQNSLIAQYDGDSNFAAGNSAPLEVVVAGFAPPPAALTVTPGQSLVIPLTVFAPTGSAMNFALSCSGLPANTSCMFDVNPVAPGPNGTTVHLTLTTMASSNLPLAPPHKGFPSPQGFELATLLAALFAAAALIWRQAPRWRLVPCMCLASFALALAIGGCGAVGSGSNPPMTTGTPAGAAAFTVTGTSGTTTISTVVNVTVR